MRLRRRRSGALFTLRPPLRARLSRAVCACPDGAAAFQQRPTTQRAGTNAPHTLITTRAPPVLLPRRFAARDTRPRHAHAPPTIIINLGAHAAPPPSSSAPPRHARRAPSSPPAPLNPRPAPCSTPAVRAQGAAGAALQPFGRRLLDSGGLNGTGPNYCGGVGTQYQYCTAHRMLPGSVQSKS